MYIFKAFRLSMQIYAELIPRFSKPEPQLCMIANQTMNIIYDTWHHLFTTFEQPWLDHPKLESFAEAIHLKGAALRNCWGFIDGTVRSISRPGAGCIKLLINHFFNHYFVVK